MKKRMEMVKIRYVENTFEKQAAVDLSGYSFFKTDNIRRIHQMAPRYASTDLVELKALAANIGVQAILVKDESTRFGLKAFKGLGGIYAMYRIICRELGLNPETDTLDMLQKDPYQARIQKMTFVTTTDGNHGKGVSWAAGVFGCKAYVYMPKGTVSIRARAIREAGNAEVTVTDLLYDDCVAYTRSLAEQNGWFLIQDTSWSGYEEVPTWIMQGYTTLYYEAVEQMRAFGYAQPTHIFLQTGVGAMAGAIAAAACASHEVKPTIVTVEPGEVACFYESFLTGDGAPHPSTGNNQTEMAGLNCATPCTIAWDILKETAKGAIACPDIITEIGMRRLAHPLGADRSVISGESGAVTTGLLETLMTEPTCKDIREKLQLDQRSIVLLISTEGDTDPEHYREIVDI